jgi:hypothetical protein
MVNSPRDGSFSQIMQGAGAVSATLPDRHLWDV